MSKRTVVTIVTALVLLIVLFAAWRIRVRRSQMTIAGQVFKAPKGWHVEGELGFFHSASQNVIPGSIYIVDRRSHPDDPKTFVANFKLGLSKNTRLRPSTVEEYRDATIDQTHMQCVYRRTDGLMPLMLFCITSRGNWRLVLLGYDSDLAGLDDFAKQLASFGDR